MPVLTTSRPARRLLAVALYLACLAAAGAAVYPLVAGDTPRVAPVDDPGEDDLPFDLIPLPPGRWLLVAPDRPTDAGREAARVALGVATAADWDPAAVPVPPGVRVSAVRVDLEGRSCGALTGPTDPTAARAAWASAGWHVADHDLGPGARAVRLTRGDRTATAWVVPCGHTVQLLVTAAPYGAGSH
ncbi:MAG: hypothetical protein ACKODX_07900 [Gemmata sp.]